MLPSRKHELARALLFSALVAGCTATPDDSERTNQETQTRLLSFTEPQAVIDLRNVQSETFIDVTPDASIRLTCLHGEFKEPSIMLVTEDSGRTWKELQATPTPGVGGDCEVALTGESGWHFVHTQAVGIVVASTFDRGASWRVNHLAGPPVATFSDRPWLEPAGEALVLSYAGFAGIQLRKSTDEGGSWSLPQVVAQPRPGYLSLPGHLVVGPDERTVVQPYLQVPVSGQDVPIDALYPGVAVSTDLGETWTDYQLPGPIEGLEYHPGAAIGPDGAIHYGYYTANGSRLDLVVRSSNDLGESWSEPWIIEPSIERARGVWMNARNDGLVDFLYQAWEAPNATADPSWTVNFVRMNPQTPHSKQEGNLAPEGFSSGNEFVSFTHDASGRAYVVFTEVHGGSLTAAPEDGSVLWTVAEELPGPTWDS